MRSKCFLPFENTRISVLWTFSLNYYSVRVAKLSFFFKKEEHFEGNVFENKMEQNKKPNYTKLEWFSKNYICGKKIRGWSKLSSFLAHLQSLFIYDKGRWLKCLKLVTRN